jgi:glucose/arabinose dehydrogenase
MDFRIRMSPTLVAPGRVAFRVVNKGAVAHDLVFGNGGRTRILRPGATQTIVVRFSKPGLYQFYCSIPGHTALGMNGTLRVGHGNGPKAPPTPSPTPSGSDASSDPSTGDLELTLVASGLAPLTYVAAPPGDPSRLMVVQQDGLVSLVKDGSVLALPFLDLRDVVRAEGEKGLLSIAFAPDYGTSGLLYAYYNDLNGNVHVVEFQRSLGDPDAARPDGRELLRVVEPTADHMGGMMQFGPDGYLYIAVGDGGANPPSIPVGVHGQTLDDLFGSILRINPREGDPYAIPPDNPFVSVLGARPEIVAYGLRNPWRFWIDKETNAMLIGDVGESTREEIDRLPLDDLGLDFGWPCREGSITPDVLIPTQCAMATLTPPLWEYSHSPTRCSVTGGVVSRDPRLPSLSGLYLWSDLCDGQLYAINPAMQTIAEQPLGLSAVQPTSFGTDALNRIYVTTVAGNVYRLDPSPAAPASPSPRLTRGCAASFTSRAPKPSSRRAVMERARACQARRRNTPLTLTRERHGRRTSPS